MEGALGTAAIITAALIVITAGGAGTAATVTGVIIRPATGRGLRLAGSGSIIKLRRVILSNDAS